MPNARLCRHLVFSACLTLMGSGACVGDPGAPSAGGSGGNKGSGGRNSGSGGSKNGSGGLNGGTGGGDSGTGGSGGTLSGSGGGNGGAGSDVIPTSAYLPARVRRLTNAEYDASVKALLGSAMSPSSQFSFPPDARQGPTSSPAGPAFTLNDAQRVDPVMAPGVILRAA